MRAWKAYNIGPGKILDMSGWTGKHFKSTVIKFRAVNEGEMDAVNQDIRDDHFWVALYDKTNEPLYRTLAACQTSPNAQPREPNLEKDYFRCPVQGCQKPFCTMVILSITLMLVIMA
ncbi:MAG: hypothetical protein GY795_32550 [Desulfobacterales bacterium]|nr:hypothetical protein [Desulfobacterales bacterium]